MSSGVQSTLLLLLLHSVGRLRPEITVARRPPFRCTPLRRAGHHRTLVLSTLWPSQPTFTFKWQDQRARRCAHEPIYVNYVFAEVLYHSSGAVWESRWPSWAVRPNEPSGFRGRKYWTMLRLWPQLVPNMSIWQMRTLSNTSSSMLYANSKHWFTTSFLQPLPYLVTP